MVLGAFSRKFFAKNKLVIANGAIANLPEGALWCKACSVQVAKTEDVGSREHAPSPEKVALLEKEVMEWTERRLDLARRQGNVHLMPKVHDLVFPGGFKSVVRRLRDAGEDIKGATGWPAPSPDASGGERNPWSPHDLW